MTLCGRRSLATAGGWSAPGGSNAGEVGITIDYQDLTLLGDPEALKLGVGRRGADPAGMAPNNAVAFVLTGPGCMGQTWTILGRLQGEDQINRYLAADEIITTDRPLPGPDLLDTLFPGPGPFQTDWISPEPGDPSQGIYGSKEVFSETTGESGDVTVTSTTEGVTSTTVAKTSTSIATEQASSSSVEEGSTGSGPAKGVIGIVLALLIGSGIAYVAIAKRSTDVERLEEKDPAGVYPASVVIGEEEGVGVGEEEGVEEPYPLVTEEIAHIDDGLFLYDAEVVVIEEEVARSEDAEIESVSEVPPSGPASIVALPDTPIETQAAAKALSEPEPPTADSPGSATSPFTWKDPQVLDTGPDGKPIPFAADDFLSVARQVLIRQPLDPGQTPRHYIRTIRITHESDTVEMVAIQEGTLTPSDPGSGAHVFSWVPEKPGTYRVEMFVSSSMENPLAQRTADFFVQVY